MRLYRLGRLLVTPCIASLRLVFVRCFTWLQLASHLWKNNFFTWLIPVGEFRMMHHYKSFIDRIAIPNIIISTLLVSLLFLLLHSICQQMLRMILFNSHYVISSPNFSFWFFCDLCFEYTLLWTLNYWVVKLEFLFSSIHVCKYAILLSSGRSILLYRISA